MIEIRREQLTMGLVAEMQPLLAAQYEELTLNRDKVKLSPKWDDYLKLQALGLLVVITARRGGKTLVGYNFFFVNTHMHYAALRVAVNDVFYIDPAYRKGSLPLRLVRWSREALRDLGVHKIAYHCKAGNNLCAILKRLGYSHEEEVVAEIL